MNASKCRYCGFMSNRTYNVLRHEKRIHCRSKRSLQCCGFGFNTKGEYYTHIESMHPKKGAPILRRKYKIDVFQKPKEETTNIDFEKIPVQTFLDCVGLLTFWRIKQSMHAEIAIIADQNCQWPQRETIKEYLRDICFENYKIK